MLDDHQPEKKISTYFDCEVVSEVISSKTIEAVIKENKQKKRKITKWFNS